MKKAILLSVSTLLVAISVQAQSYLCADVDTGQTLISVTQTDRVAATRPGGAKVYEIEMLVPNRSFKGIGVITEDKIDVAASDSILGQVRLMAQPKNDDPRFNLLSMMGEIKTVRCTLNRHQALSYCQERQVLEARIALAKQLGIDTEQVSLSKLLPGAWTEATANNTGSDTVSVVSGSGHQKVEQSYVVRAQQVGSSSDCRILGLNPR